ncbi:MAG: hypothetical protein KJ000_17775 [Pirellulaceae bacterium]|nr:hypothetical protein [Pirellulaceae bacterium]
MEEFAGIACVLLVVLTFVTVVGHGMWLVLAALFRWLAVEPVEPLSRSRNDWRDDLQAAYRQLESLRGHELLDADHLRMLQERLRAFERKMLAQESRASLGLRPEMPAASEAAVDSAASRAPSSGIPTIPPEPMADVIEAILVEPEAATPPPAAAVPPVKETVASPPTATEVSPRPVHPLDREYPDQRRQPSRARRALADVFQSFMAEKNIRWGELVSGLLIVGSAVGLVISLRTTLRDTIPYFPALIFLMITLAIYGAGMYTLRRWNLQATSRGVLIIALLLSPLNFVAAIVLSGPDQRPVTDPWYLGAVALGLLVCGGITYSGGRALIGAGWWRLTTAVLATSMGQLIVDRQTDLPLTAGGTSLLLGLPLAGYLAAVVTQILRAAAWPRLSARRAQQIFIVLGVATFSFLAPVALFLSHADPLRDGVASLAPVLSVVAGVILVAGLLVQQRTEARALAALRTGGTWLAVAGAMLMVSALVLAWPRPDLLIVVGLVNFTALAVLAVGGRLPVLHAPAVGCLALAALVGFHVWQANVAWSGEPDSKNLVQWLLAGRSGLVLLLLSVLSAAVATVWDRFGRRAEGLAYLAASGGLGGLSLLVACWAGFILQTDTPLTTPIFAFYAVAALAAAWALGRRGSEYPQAQQGLAGLATVLWFVAWFHAVGRNEVCIAWLSEWLIEPDRPWTLALVAHSLSTALAALVIAAPTLRPRKAETTEPVPAPLIPALAGGATLSASFAVALALPVVDFAFVPAAIYIACASVAWLVTAVIYRHRGVWNFFQAVASLAVVYAVAGWDEGWWPMQARDQFVQLLQMETIVLGLWCLAWSLSRRLRSGAGDRDGVPLSRTAGVGPFGQEGSVPFFVGWETVDEWLLAALVAAVAWLATFAAWPGLSWEIGEQVLTPMANETAKTWIALAIIAAALLISLAGGAIGKSLIGLLITGAAGALLLATFGPVESTASAWRWWSAGYVLVTSAAIWFRGPIYAATRRLRWLAPGEIPAATTVAVRETALLLGAGPIIGVTTAIAIRSSADLAVGAVPADSFFGRLGMTVSYAAPLVVLVAVLLGHALRERRPLFAVAGSLVLQYVVSLGFLLQVSPDKAGFAAGLLQWNLAALAGYSLVWLALRRRIRPEGASGRDVMLGGQVQVTLGVLTVLGGWAALSVAVTPGELGLHGQPLGQPLSYAAWLAACVAAVWHARSCEHRSIDSLLRPAVACGWLLVALIAVTVDPLDVSRQWLAYHVLTCGGLLLTAAVTTAWWRYPGMIGDAVASGSVVFLLGFRGGWSDPHWLAPWWSVAACGAVAVQAAVLSLRGRSQIAAYGSALAAVTATTIYWLGPFQGRWQRNEVQAVFELITADLVAVLAAAAVWLAAEIWWQRRGEGRGRAEESREALPNSHEFGYERQGCAGLDERFRGPRLHVAAPLFALVLLTMLFFTATLANSLVVARQGAAVVDLVGGGGWLAAWMLLIVLAGALWDDRSRHGLAGLYVGGLMFASLIIDRVRLAPPDLLGTVLATAAGYVMLTGFLWRRGASLATLGAGWGIREPIVGLQRTGGWLPGASLLLTLCTALAALAVVSTFEGRSLRYTAAATPAMLAMGIGALAQQQRRAHFQMLALLLTGLATVYLGWADLSPRWDERGLLLRMFRLLMALSALTFFYGALLPRWFEAHHAWRDSIRRAAATFGVAGVVSLLGVLVMEFVAFRTGGIAVSAEQVAAVAVVLVALIVGLIALALQTGGALPAWSERQRMGCVYAAELAAALLFLHLYLCRPDWFAGFLRPYWPYVVMGVAFAGVSVGHLCQRAGLRVLSEPLVSTGAFLPLLPAVGYWVVVADGTDYSLLLFAAGLIYVLLSIQRRSAASAAAAVVAGNGALWALLHDSGFSLWQQPQFWLIPPAVSALIAGQLNRRRLTGEQLTALRYASMLVIYVSSTSEMFLRGIGSSLWPPMILASLSVAGMLLGIALRIRAFLYLGASFVLLSVVSMVWHAAKAIEHSWPWWAFGIGLGVAILALFAVFEKKRPDIIRWAESMRQWDQ